MIQSEYPSVLLIYTGGTIGMIENPETGALEAFNFDQLQDNVPELKRFNYRISSYQFNPPLSSFFIILLVNKLIEAALSARLKILPLGERRSAPILYLLHRN